MKQINLSNFINPFGYIYCHKNTINNKRYIGANISRTSPRNLFINGKRRTLNAFLSTYHGCTYFLNALKKYGIESFKTIVLAFTIDLKDTEKKEAFYIKKFNTMNKKYGYNLKISGLNGFFSDEVKKKIGEKSKGRIPWNKGKKGIYSEDTLKRISETQIGKKPWNKGLIKETDERVKKYSKSRIGMKFTDDHRKNLKESHKGQISWNKGGKLSDNHKNKLRNAKKGEKYYCSFCKGEHYNTSKIGKEHLKIHDQQTEEVVA